MKALIPFNIPHLTGNEMKYMEDAVHKRVLSGNGDYTKKCHAILREKIRCKMALLTTSCTDALEMSALLLNIKPGDEVIMPSYTFVSTANAFVLRGARIQFVDSRPDHPGIDESKIEELINEKTKAIVPVHYAGVACDMDKIMEAADAHGVAVVEDAAQALDSYYKGRPLGGIGKFGVMSFHETKNLTSGEGGALFINSQEFVERSEIIWEKGTNRAAFWRGEVNKYGWVDIGSSFLASDLTAAFLFAQLESIALIQNTRKRIWDTYYKLLLPLAEIGVSLPNIPDYATNNAHMFFLIARTAEERERLINQLRIDKVYAMFHYLSLHKSPFYHKKHDGRQLPECDKYADRLVRLPLYYDLTENEQDRVTESILRFYKKY